MSEPKKGSKMRVLWDLKSVNPCIKAAILRGFIKLDMKNPLDQVLEYALEITERHTVMSVRVTTIAQDGDSRVLAFIRE